MRRHRQPDREIDALRAHLRQRVLEVRMPVPHADKCLELAESFKDPDAKRTLFAMAAAWLTLAAQRVKNIEMADTSSTVGQDLTPPYDPD